MNKSVVIKARVKIEDKEPFFESRIKTIFYNGASYGGVYSTNKVFERKSVNDVARYMYTALKFSSPAVVYVEKQGFLVKMIVEINEEGEFITVESVDHIKFFDEPKGIVDLGFYVKTCVELCEDFVIYELKSE